MSLVARTVVVLLLACGMSQTPLNFCDLLRNPQQHSGQEVRIRATYRYGFEWSELYCLSCRDKGKAWLEFAGLDDASDQAVRRLPKGSGIVNLTVQGTFVSGARFGHENRYLYKIVARKVSDVAIVQKGIKPQAVEEKTERRWACGGTEPK